MYVNPNFKTKKSLKEAIDNGQTIKVFTVSPFEVVPCDGIIFLEGPHYPEPHKWYAKATMKNGKIISIK